MHGVLMKKRKALRYKFRLGSSCERGRRNIAHASEII